MERTVAVTVEAPRVVLDEDYRIVEVGSAAQAAFGPLLGHDLWESFPDSEPLFRPYYEKARRTGEPVEFVQFYRGSVARIRAVPAGCRLALYWQTITRIDTLTLDRLRASVEGALRLVTSETSRTLRVIQGGA
jgi:hypothetical protein